MDVRDDTEVSIAPDVDPAALEVGGDVVKDAIFIIPSDAPLPGELKDHSSSGSLLQRLLPLDSDPKGIGVVPLSGAELISLAQAWRAICVARKVFVLHELPGARYDVIFTQAARQIGLRRLDWPEIMDAVARREALLQSTRDGQGWRVDEQSLGDGALAARPRSSAPLSIPSETED